VREPPKKRGRPRKNPLWGNTEWRATIEH